MNSSKKSPKIAILVSGQMRTFEKCVDNLRENIFHLDCETFLHTSPEPEVDAKIALYEFDHVCIEEDPLIEKNYNYIGRSEFYAIKDWDKRTFLQLWGLQKAWDLLEERTFDWVFRLRPDTILTRKFELLHKLENNKLYIPRSDSHYGLNDRFAVGDYGVMRTYMRRYDEIDDYLSLGGVLHPEEYLKYTMIKHNIPVKQLPLDVVLRRPDHDQKLVRYNYDRFLWWWRNVPHVRDKGRWGKPYEDRRGRYVKPDLKK